jgi:hypothetical protein
MDFTLKIISELSCFPVTQRYRMSFTALYYQLKCNGDDTTVAEAKNVKTHHRILTVSVCPDICTLL